MQDFYAKIQDGPPAKADAAVQAENNGAHAGFIKELANSFAYTAVEAPAMAVSQLAGNGAMERVQKAFDKVGVHAPVAEKVGSAGWYAQTIGGAAGIVAPLKLTKFALGKMGILAAAAESSEIGALTKGAATSSVMQMSLKESAVMGLAYGALLTPSSEKARSTGLASFIADRALSSASSALTFSTLTAGSFGMGSLAKSAAAAERTGLAAALSNRLVAGTISGLPAGLINSEFDSLSRNHQFASRSELSQSLLGMSVVGGTFGALGYLKPTARAETLQEPAKTIAAPPTDIDPNQFRKSPEGDPAQRLTLSEGEQNLWRDITKARTVEDFKKSSEAIDDLPLDRHAWFTSMLDHQAKNLTDSELHTLWPELLQTDKHQAYRIGKVIGPERTGELWRATFANVKAGYENIGSQTDINTAAQKQTQSQLALEAVRTMSLIEPARQIEALKDMLALPVRPAQLDMTATLLAEGNQLAAAKLLSEHGITPQIETAKTAPSSWADFALTLPPGSMRASLIEQLGRKINNVKDPAAEVNKILKVAENRLAPGEYETFNSMFKTLTKNYGGFAGGGEAAVALRQAALDGVDAKFVARMMFAERDWPKSDQAAAQNPELIKALATNSQFSPSLVRSAFLSELISGDKPLTAKGLTETIIANGRENDGTGKRTILSPGDIQALFVEGLAPSGGLAAKDVPALLGPVREDVLEAFNLNQGRAVDRNRLWTSLSVASAIGRVNPAVYESQFKEPVEASLADQSIAYGRRLEAARALGELQREKIEGAQALTMPELRMGKIVELPQDLQRQYRQSAEQALFSRPAIAAQLGDGPLGRLMPQIFGHASEGGVVGRLQHGTHESSLDNHLLDVVEKVGQDSEFGKLLEKDQVNVLWAALLHDVGKRESMVDPDHNWASTSMAWGVLRTLGYADTRIQRITDLMSKDADLSYAPDVKNSQRLTNRRTMDNVVNFYRNPDALNMVAILNRSDIKSVKLDGSWFTPEVAAELDKVQEMAGARVRELNKHLLPVLPSALPTEYGAYEMTDYNVLGHATYNLEQFLKQRATIESPEYSMSTSLLTPANHQLYADGLNTVVLVNGPFEHISQANRANLSTGTSVGLEGHLGLVDQWASSFKARELAQEMEGRLADLGIPPAVGVAPEFFPRLEHLRRIVAQFDTQDELRERAGANDPYVRAVEQVTELLTTTASGRPIENNNEIKLNNPVVSGIGILRKGNQPVYFEGVAPGDLKTLWQGHVPDYVSAGPAGRAPIGAITVSEGLAQSARKNNLPIVILR